MKRRSRAAFAELIAGYRARTAAIDKSHAVIVFSVDGMVECANENFLSTMGYTLEEVRAQHHRLFVEPAYARSAAYVEFWRRLNNGEHIMGECKRIAKNGPLLTRQRTPPRAFMS